MIDYIKKSISFFFTLKKKIQKYRDRYPYAKKHTAKKLSEQSKIINPDIHKVHGSQ